MYMFYNYKKDKKYKNFASTIIFETLVLFYYYKFMHFKRR